MSATIDAQSMVDRVPVLRSLPAEEKAALLAKGRWRRFAPQDQIIDRDDEGRDVFFVIEGCVRVVIYSLSGREISFDDIGEGRCFGELAAIDNQPRSANVIALVDTLVLVVPQQAFLDLATRNPAVALTVMRSLAGALRRATERIMDLSTIGANNRVHAEILRLARPGLKPDNTAVISPIPLHGDIAARVSTTRETVARVFSDLTRSGLVERRQESLLIKDFRRLSDMVHEVRGEM
jgi:CRP-like cAMP-binding protein